LYSREQGDEFSRSINEQISSQLYDYCSQEGLPSTGFAVTIEINEQQY
jgi:hypothetical protein